MLRTGLLIVGLLLTGTGLVLLLKPGSCCWHPFLLWGAVLVIAVLCERWRYRRNEHADGERWQKTDERFLDHETGQTVDVYYDPASGERRYVKGEGRVSKPKDG